MERIPKTLLLSIISHLFERASSLTGFRSFACYFESAPLFTFSPPRKSEDSYVPGTFF